MENDKFYADEDGYYDLKSCSLLIGDTMTIFGGENQRSQISVVYPTGIQRIGTLPFQFSEGRCHYSDKTIYLCYPFAEKKLCRQR